MSDDVFGRIGEEVARLDQLMKRITVFACDQAYHHVHVGLVEKRFLYS